MLEMENVQDKYRKVLVESLVLDDDVAVEAQVREILDKHFDENNNVDVWKQCFHSIDLTTLNSTDTVQSVTRFVQRVNDFETDYPQLPNVAAICTYPNFAMVVSGTLEVSEVGTAVVAGSFPSSQTFVEVKTAETALAVADGATEVDIVFNLGLYYDEQYEELADEIAEIKHACRDARLKVILETGALKKAADIKNAAILSMWSGADFIKTSTGKVYPGATLEAAYVMCQCIKEYHKKTGRKVGFKVSGGVSTTDDAVRYYTLVKEILGDEWLTNEWFRIGTSRAANVILSSILGKETKHF
ncbi:MAG: deoxyribose-phosphate aldolase [Candidatus Limisoma sp.]